jgi:hypothetical protein
VSDQPSNVRSISSGEPWRDVPLKDLPDHYSLADAVNVMEAVGLEVRLQVRQRG